MQWGTGDHQFLNKKALLTEKMEIQLMTVMHNGLISATSTFDEGSMISLRLSSLLEASVKVV